MRSIFYFACIVLLTAVSAHGANFSTGQLSKNQIDSLIESGAWNDDCPVKIDRLRIITVSYWDFNGEKKEGKVMALEAAAPFLQEAFKKLYEIKFPIAKIELADNYRKVNASSNEDNNTLCFNCYKVEGTDHLSVHAYGLAIDINPVQNPFVEFPDHNKSIARFSPSGSIEYANRNIKRSGMVEEIKDIFKQAGFTVWGGDWKSEIDYMHFQVARGLCSVLVEMTPDVATDFFETHAANAGRGEELGKLMYDELIKITGERKLLVDFYKENPKDFLKVYTALRKAILA